MRSLCFPELSGFAACGVFYSLIKSVDKELAVYDCDVPGCFVQCLQAVKEH
ncbi:MAG: hypothetical protein QXK12_00400 [Candidatus Nezhaarchaeales archaeon]